MRNVIASQGEVGLEEGCKPGSEHVEELWRRSCGGGDCPIAEEETVRLLTELSLLVRCGAHTDKAAPSGILGIHPSIGARAPWNKHGLSLPPLCLFGKGILISACLDEHIFAPASRRQAVPVLNEPRNQGSSKAHISLFSTATWERLIAESPGTPGCSPNLYPAPSPMWSIHFTWGCFQLPSSHVASTSTCPTSNLRSFFVVVEPR